MDFTVSMEVHELTSSQREQLSGLVTGLARWYCDLVKRKPVADDGEWDKVTIEAAHGGTHDDNDDWFYANVHVERHEDW